MKTPTLATATKSIITDEIRITKKAIRKVESDAKKDIKKLATAQWKIVRDIVRINRTEKAAKAKLARRLAILEGRL